MSSPPLIAGKASGWLPAVQQTVPPRVAGESRATFPKQLKDKEQCLVDKRRKQNGVDPDLPRVGLALSGGGVRSATFSLGFLQSLASNHVLRTVDYLSTVSGGGYIGAFLGRFYTRFINRPSGAIDLIEARLSDPASPEISWLRRCSAYMAVGGGGDAPVTTAVLLRSFLTVHIVLGMLLVAVFNIFNLFRYGALAWLLDQVRLRLPSLTWLLRHVEPLPPWFLLLGIVVVSAFLPLAIAYWLPSDSRAESYSVARVVALIITSGTGFVMALEEHAWLAAGGIVWATVLAFVWIEAAWARVALNTPAATGHPTGRGMVRAKVNRWLATAAAGASAILGIWVLDELVYMSLTMLQRHREAMPLRDALGVVGLTFALLFWPLRWLALRLFAGGAARGGRHRLLWRVLTNPFLLPAASGALLLIQWDLISHAMFHFGKDVSSGIVWMVVTLVTSALLGGRGGIVLVNWSSLQLLYAARGSRTYLGASNPYRHASDEGADITSPQPEDDIDFDRYQPYLAGGPLHFINVLVNQSLDRTSGRRTRDRPGENMAVGPCGVSVGAESHGLWVADPGRDDTSTRLLAVDVGDLPAPFVPRRDSQDDPESIEVSTMQLSGWMSISGSALSPDAHADTSLGTSLIYGLANVRSGFWWDSGIEEGNRFGEPIAPPSRRLWRFIKRRFRAQGWLLAEFTGRFTGPWRRYWYLADGGGVENLGIYELVRRRVPIIICADATRDVDGGLTALGNAIRRVRLDLGAEIEFLPPCELGSLATLPQDVLSAIGSLDDVRFSNHSGSRKHAAVARIRYGGTSEQSVLLYVKATMTGDEPVDVLEYHRQHHRFPHQSVLDQSLDEAQWESYRALGQHCAHPLFSERIQWLADLFQALQARPEDANGHA